MPDWSSLQVPAAIIADLAGFLALILSVYVFFVSRRDKKPRLTVGVDVAEVEVQYDETGYPETPPLDILFIDVANPSERRVKVQSVMIEIARFVGPIKYRRVREHYPHLHSKPEPPAFVTPGDDLVFSTELDEFVYWIRDTLHLDGKLKYRPIVHDATGNSYSGNWRVLAE